MSDTEQPKPGVALMFSGGMDSYLVWKLWGQNPDPQFRVEHLVFCAAGHRYQRRELDAIVALGLASKVIVDRSLNLGAWEREADAQVPLRNLLFACVGSRYADRVWMAFLDGEQSHDKTHLFGRKAGEVMSVCYDTSYWCAGRDVEVGSPCWNMTKAELLAAALAKGAVNMAELSSTVSCYAQGGFCGECSSCFKRAVATVLNGWIEPYKKDPFKSQAGLAAMEKAKAGVHYPEKRRREMLDAQSRVK